ncbi:MAG: hypothetical protein ACOYL3_26555, partial [Desulfuromonadaceae bacterium]
MQLLHAMQVRQQFSPPFSPVFDMVLTGPRWTPLASAHSQAFAKAAPWVTPRTATNATSARTTRRATAGGAPFAQARFTPDLHLI